MWCYSDGNAHPCPWPELLLKQDGWVVVWPHYTKARDYMDHTVAYKDETHQGLHIGMRFIGNNLRWTPLWWSGVQAGCVGLPHVCTLQ